MSYKILPLLILGLAIGCSAHLPEKNPTAALTNVQLGLAYLEQGNVQRSKNKLLLALEQNSRSSVAWGAMGYYLETTGHLEMAETYYKKAIQLSPKSGPALNNYGAFLCRKGDYQAAEQYFMMALKDVTYTKFAEVYENAALCALEAKEYSKAKQYFSKALIEDPNRITALMELRKIE
ncbi:MAG: type IV pilus biogenesis/stability protein PilW [Proteobacteria bacterium]|nr:type IV pilus biogenesis/stability protein PilW [Pseudomonadota bacterium]